MGGLNNGLSGPISTGGPTEFDAIKTHELEKVSVVAAKGYCVNHLSFICVLIQVVRKCSRKGIKI